MGRLNRLEVKAQIVECNNCALSARCTAPVPFSGPTPTSFAVVGEAPGKFEDEKGKPFVGPSGEYLRRTLKEVGLPEPVFMNAVSCFPLDFEGKGRTPNGQEVAACSTNLNDQLALADPEYVLLTGSIPLKAVRPGLKIGQARGRPFLRDSTVHSLGTTLCMATYHPSYVLRSGGPGSKADLLVRQDMEALFRLMEAEDRMTLFPDDCLECEELAERFTVDGLGYCLDHWKPVAER